MYQVAMPMIKRQKSLLCSPLLGAILVSMAFFIASALIVIDHKQVDIVFKSFI